MKKLSIFILIVLFSFIPEAFAANWYVDNAANGSNNGTSWANAWESFGSISWGSISPGDTMFISGGSSSKTYNETLNIGASGSSGNNIVIKTGQTSGHNGTVIIDGRNTQNQGIIIGTYDYITIDGEVSENRGMVIRNFNHNGIYGTGIIGVTLRYLEVYDCGSADNWDRSAVLLNSAQTGVLIEYCYIHHGGLKGLHLQASSGGWTWGGIIVRHNEISYNCDDGISGSWGIDIYNNHIHHNGVGCHAGHPDGIQTMGSYLRMYNNELNDNATQNIILSFNSENSGHVYIYNNIIYDTTRPSTNSRGVALRTTANVDTVENVLIANNTFVDQWVRGGPSISINNASRITGTGSNQVQFLNNIIYNGGLSAKGMTIECNPEGTYGDSNVYIDYNLINAGPNGGTLLEWRGNYYGDSAAFAAAGYGQDHSQTGDPNFVSYSQYSQSNDFHLNSGSSAIDNAINLSSYFTTDYDGNTRSGAWDIGAYEYTGSRTDTKPSSPQNLQIIK